MKRVLAGIELLVLQHFPEKKKTRFDKRQKKPSEVISNYFGDPKKMIRHYGLKLQVC